MQQARRDGGSWLGEQLELEFIKDSLQRRQALFRSRSYDRTVHPTQRYSLAAEMALDTIVARLVARRPVESDLVNKAGQEILQEYLGRNVSINSQQEADEILLDFDALVSRIRLWLRRLFTVASFRSPTLFGVRWTFCV